MQTLNFVGVSKGHILIIYDECFIVQNLNGANVLKVLRNNKYFESFSLLRCERKSST